MELFRKGKIHMIAKFCLTDLVICSHSRERKIPSDTGINTEIHIKQDFEDIILRLFFLFNKENICCDPH